MTEVVFKETFFAAIFSPTYKRNLEFRGNIKSLSSAGSEGSFDILPLHENFLSIVNGPVVIVDEAGKKHEINVEKALVEVSNNIVKVFVDF